MSYSPIFWTSISPLHMPHTLPMGWHPCCVLLRPFLQLRPDDLHFRCCLADFMGRSWPWLTWDTLRKQWGSVKPHIYSKGLNRSSHPSLTQLTNITWDHCRASEWLVAGTSGFINFEAKVLSASWDLHKVEHFRCPSLQFPSISHFWGAQIFDANLFKLLWTPSQQPSAPSKHIQLPCCRS